MNSNLQTRDFDGFEKPSERGVPAAGEELKSGTPAVTRPQRPLALPMMALQRPLGANGRWDQGRSIQAAAGFNFSYQIHRSLCSNERWRDGFEIH
ncbi:hypothetical protein C2S51_017807 [Perilla frutescens var. frutescens]|nr:hypothetical protein C2S51_017807 [Perilla frutescens var. frutescens]